MKLLLIRHAKAEKHNASKWPDDSVRPLSRKGAERFINAARGLRKIVTPDVLLTSPYVRAARTAALLERHAKWPEPVEDERIPNGELAAIVEAVVEEEYVGTLALVGHEPALSTFASRLISGSSAAAMQMKPGSAALINLHSAKSGELQWLATPKMLYAAGK